MSTPFNAIYLDDKGELSVRQIDEMYTPQGDQSLIEVKYSAINPANVRHFYMGMHSFVTGYEWVGPVVEVGPNSPYKVGEMLFGLAMFGHKRPMHRGAHQDYLLADTWGTNRLPKDLDNPEGWKQAVTWPTGAHTAIDMLFNELDFAWPGVPGLEEGVDPRDRAILIWGGSSVVGISAIQIAKAAGFSPIYTTASPKNHETLLKFGATHVFDYRSPTVVEEIREAVAKSGKELSVIADAVTTGTGYGEPPSDIKPDLSKTSVAIAKRTLTEGAKDVRLVASLGVDFDPDWKFCWAMRNKEEWPIWHDRLEAAIQWLWDNHKGIFSMPKVTVVKGAEASIQAMYDVYEGKASMEKFVVEHPII